MFIYSKSFALTLTLYTFTLGGGGNCCKVYFNTYKTPSNTSKQPI